MRADAQAEPTPVHALEPLSAEDQAVLDSLDLLEDLDLLEVWEPADERSLPAARKADTK
jgi:hypothetical protein